MKRWQGSIKLLDFSFSSIGWRRRLGRGGPSLLVSPLLWLLLHCSLPNSFQALAGAFESRSFSFEVRPAPPVPPAPHFRDFSGNGRTALAVQLQGIPPGLGRYSIGNPTDEEQLYLELINRSRSDPKAEAERYRSATEPDVVQDFKNFKVDLVKLASDFATISPAPPLSMNANLTAAARLHSQDMLANQFQGHTGSKGSTTGDRITTQGYVWSAYGENVFSNARSVGHGHAGFDVDWGGNASTGGVQDPPGHRTTIHNPLYREIGIGVVIGRNGKAGPQLVTQDFGSRHDLTPFVTGVAYYDLNRDGSYDIGEGIEGATALVDGARFYALSAASGGYSVPVPANGIYRVTFDLSGLPETKMTAVISAQENVKVDFTPAYQPPVVSGPDLAAVRQNTRYQFTSVGGAQSYQWKRSNRVPATEREGAENGTAKVIVAASASYEVIDRNVKASGEFSFHLAHPEKADQILTLQRLYSVTESSQLVFASRLGWAGTAQTAKAQVSADGGVSWLDVWTQVGTENRGQDSFSVQAISLRPFAGREVTVRFRYDFGSGSFLPDTDPSVGFYIDDIGVTDADELFDEIVGDVSSGAAFDFNAPSTGDYSLRVRARFASRTLPWGPPKLVAAQIGAAIQPSVRITSVERISGDRIQIDFECTDAAPAGFDLQSADLIGGAWTPDSSATISPLGEAGRFRAIASAQSGVLQFYRVRSR